MKKALLLVLFAVSCFAFTESEYLSEFRDWQLKYGVQYNGVQEFFYRYDIFKKNLDYVTAYNARKTGMTLKINAFADLPNEEYQAKYLYKMISPEGGDLMVRQDLILPNGVDWRDKGAVTPVKNQKGCGACWTFSTTGSVEGAHFIKTGDLISLSEQQLLDCCTQCGGCRGGNMVTAFNCIMEEGGLDTEECYPYEMEVKSCRIRPECQKVNIVGYERVEQGDEEALAQSVTAHPTSIGMDARHISFQFYDGGVYQEEDCTDWNLNHAVLAVGFGESEEGKYWIVKNSWGADWGEDGYIRIPKDQNNYCGVATDASYPKV